MSKCKGCGWKCKQCKRARQKIKKLKDTMYTHDEVIEKEIKYMFGYEILLENSKEMYDAEIKAMRDAQTRLIASHKTHCQKHNEIYDIQRQEIARLKKQIFTESNVHVPSITVIAGCCGSCETKKTSK
jgi:hypothetical protein